MKRSLAPMAACLTVSALVVCFLGMSDAVEAQHASPTGSAQLTATAGSMAAAIEQFSADLQTLERRYRVPLDAEAVTIRTQHLQDWFKRLQALDFDALDRVDQTDFLLLRSEIEYRLEKQALDAVRDAAAADFLPFAADIVAFLRNRENVELLDAAAAAANLDQTAAAVERWTQSRLETAAAQPAASSQSAVTSNSAVPVEQEGAADRVPSAPATSTSTSTSTSTTSGERLAALRGSELLNDLKRSLREAHGFYSGYDPQYSWWCTKPMERLLAALESQRVVLREKVVGVPDADQETIIGLPIGAEGLALELRHEWIAHAPAELIALAEREMSWCDAQMAAASAELGCGDDWRRAMELVKNKHVQPGAQPQMIRELAWEATRFVESHDLVTVPPLAAGGWTMSMMSPERQRVNPYFLGGDTIIVSFPTDSMTHEEKLMSMRSNNEHFSRATVHHELIPGHHLQYYMLPRYRPYRRLFATPFWMEGWALYWEMLLWDLDFARGPEDRVGMLFWRKHRCARIIFSLDYQLGEMSPDECVDYLVDRVGHERSAASAEVRRTIMGGYSPLYQAAYMLGGLQLRNLHEEMVQSGRMTNRDFHDAILHEHSIPIEVLRNYLINTPLRSDMQPQWRFAD